MRSVIVIHKNDEGRHLNCFRVRLDELSLWAHNREQTLNKWVYLDDNYQPIDVDLTGPMRLVSSVEKYYE